MAVALIFELHLEYRHFAFSPPKKRLGNIGIFSIPHHSSCFVSAKRVADVQAQPHAKDEEKHPSKDQSVKLNLLPQPVH